MCVKVAGIRWDVGSLTVLSLIGGGGRKNISGEAGRVVKILLAQTKTYPLPDNN